MPPLISFVVPVHGVEPYLAQCIDSILGQSGDAQSGETVELVAVDDCSPDNCGAILDDYATADSRVRVLHLEHNVGLGAARDAGLAAATGDYVWFVDGDDWLAPGAVDAVVERLNRVGPDVLVVDFALSYDGGRSEGHPWSYLLREPPPPETFRLAERLSLLRLVMTAWNKVVRREFLLGLGVRFGSGYYEDLSVTYPILVAAEHISVLDRVCYHYRRGRDGAITATTSRRHFDLFEQYAAVFAFLDARGGSDAVRRAVFDRTVLHAATVFATPGLVPESDRREFFAEMARNFRRWRPPGHRFPGGMRGVQYRLLARDAYRPYVVLLAANRTRRRAARASLTLAFGADPRHRGASSQAGGRLAKALRIAYYRACLLLPMDGRLAVYAAYWYSGYSCNPRAIYEEARELAPTLHGVWVVRADRVGELPPGVDYVVADTPRYLRTLARARYLVNNVNFPHEISKRRGSIHVQTQHGTPVKTLGLDLRDRPAAARAMNFDRLVEHCGRWDFLVSPNHYSTEIWTRVYPGAYQVLEVGYPRNDRFARTSSAEVAAVRADLGIAPGQTALLYAPTFREGEEQKATPLLDPRRLATALGPDWVVLLRAHYFYADFGTTPSADGGARIVDVTAHSTVEDLCLAADVLVTDYSSIMFDYACLDRPIVVYAPDWDRYRETRGTYLDVLAEPPGATATTEDELVACLTSGDYAGAPASELRAAFRKRFCSLEDGHAAERVVRRVFRGERGD